jgi:hypothetical protein
MKEIPQRPAPQVWEIDGLRYYRMGEGDDWYPSVTSIIHASSTPTPYALRSKRPISGAMARGTTIHKLCEYWLRGYRRIQPEISPEVKPYWESIRPALRDIKGGPDPIITEKFVWHKAEKYAGTFDCLGTYKGVPNTLVDFKTCANPSRLTKPQLHSYFLQLVAYSGAIQDTLGVEVSQGVLLIASPECEPIEVKVTRESITELWPEWVELRQGFAARLEKKQARRDAVVKAFNGW